MNELSLDELMLKVDSRYTLVSVAAKRARQINEEREKAYNNPKDKEYDELMKGKTVSIALGEIYDDEIGYIRTVDNLHK